MKLTFIWQDMPNQCEVDWVAEIFAPVAGENVIDGKHSLVLNDCLLIDSYVHAWPAEYYRKFRGKDAWLLQLSDETYEGGYAHYRNFRGVFRNYWSGIFNPRRVMQIPLGYASGVHSQEPLPTSAARKYLWCFLGTAAIGTRPEMIRAFRNLEPAFVRITHPKKVLPLGRAEYTNVLRDSIFVPAPMGNVNLECFRIYEALECGAIPLLEKRPRFDYFRSLLGPHPLPTFTNWDEAAQFVHELRQRSLKMDDLAKECSRWWREFKSQLSAEIEDFIERTRSEETEDFVRWTQGLPGWHIYELLRHHNGKALARRFGKHLSRLKAEKKLRKISEI